MPLGTTTGHLTATWSHNMQKYKHPRLIPLPSPAPPPCSAMWLGDSMSEVEWVPYRSQLRHQNQRGHKTAAGEGPSTTVPQLSPLREQPFCRITGGYAL